MADTDTKKPAPKTRAARPVVTEARFISALKASKVKQFGAQYTLAHKGTTYKIASRDVLERVLYDIYRQEADGKTWLAPSGKAIPPYLPQHEPTPEFKAAFAAI
jgi:hypothetical protein